LSACLSPFGAVEIPQGMRMRWDPQGLDGAVLSLETLRAPTESGQTRSGLGGPLGSRRVG